MGGQRLRRSLRVPLAVTLTPHGFHNATTRAEPRRGSISHPHRQIRRASAAPLAELLRFPALRPELPELPDSASTTVSRQDRDLVFGVVLVVGAVEPPALCLRSGRPPTLCTPQAHKKAIVKRSRRPEH